MVQSLHGSGLGVIMDVVYNHTYDANSNFNKIVPYYYYRLNADGTNTGASGCGNDTASERVMFRKFMVDSVSYWAEEYNLDGFRFDLMGLHDVETMQAIEKAVHAINPNAIIYGEAWNMAGSTTSATMATQPNLGKITGTVGAAGAVAAFNDAIRDGLKGSVFDAKAKGYISGAYAENAAKVQFGIMGASSSTGVGWSIPGCAIINYMSAHDNNTLWDKLHLSNPDNTTEELLAMNRLGAAILMISKGTPFWQAGEEMLRSKPNADGTFNENSYNASDAVNNINWELLTADSEEYAMMRYYQGLIALRKHYDIFRSNGEDVAVTFDNLAGGGMVAKFVAADGREALVVINPTATADTYTLTGSWNLVADATRAGASVLETMSGEVSVAACSILIFVK
jgi:pullulanase